MKTILYTGLTSHHRTDARVIHCPLIETVPRPHDSPDILHALSQLPKVTHLIMTSKTAASCFFALDPQSIHDKTILSVGKSTTNYLKSLSPTTILTASNECQEGIIEMFEQLPDPHPCFFWGHSSLSRLTLSDFLKQKQLPLIECILYDTVYKAPEKPICLDEIDEIFFSSPSTVEAFCLFFGPLPKDKILNAQGAITALAIKQKFT